MYHQLQNVLCGNRWYDIYKLVWMKLVLKQILRLFATNLSQKFSGMNGKYLAILFVKLLCQPTLYPCTSDSVNM